MTTKDFVNYLRQFADYVEHMEGIKNSVGHMKLDEFFSKYKDELSTRAYNVIASEVKGKDGYWLPTVYQFLAHSKSVRNFGNATKEEIENIISNS